MYLELKRDILKAMSTPRTVYSLKGIKVSREDCQSLMTLCNLYEREGDIGNWRDAVTSTPIAEVLIKYKMW